MALIQRALGGSSSATHKARSRLLPFRGWLLGAVDLGAWLLGFIATARISLGPNGSSATVGSLIGFVIVISIVQVVIGHSLGLYRGRFRVGGYDEAVVLAVTWIAVLASTSLLEMLISADGWLPETPTLFRSSVALTVMVLVRFLWRSLLEHALRPDPEGCKRVVIFGAGEAGYMLVRGMLTDPTSKSVPVALLDDDSGKANRSMMGIRVVGTLDDLGWVVKRFNADRVVIAIPTATSALIGRVVDAAREANLEVRTLPSPSELAEGIGVADIRPINEDDLLDRDQVEVDVDRIRSYLTGKRVLVTGAGGSIGSELCRQLHSLNPAELIMLDRDENGLHSTQLSIEGRALLDSPSLVVADIRDQDRLRHVFATFRPEVVFHAAALKHLTLLEQHPIEGVKTNVFGSRNVIECALEYGAECVVNVSTDKAADPTSVLGATKLLAEQVAAEYAERSDDSRVVSVRFGNVLGSRGSVLPTFLQQIKCGGPVTVTHPDVTRYFMTIPEAVRLVLQAGAIGDTGEIMILDMGGPVRIVDLAKRLISHHDPSVEIVFTGLRPGEKLNEILIADHEVGERRAHPRVLHTQSEPALNLDRVLEGLEGRVTIDPAELVDVATMPARTTDVDPAADDRVDITPAGR